MKKYQCIKTVMAEPMDRVTAEIKGLVRDKHVTVGEPAPGFKVMYEDGYVSWSPLEAFEKGYKEIV